MSIWEEDSEAFSGLKCNFHPRCIFCNLPMKIFDIKLLKFSLDPTKPKEKTSNAIDVCMYCYECGYVDVFGVAISPEHSKKMKDKIIKGIEEKTFGHVVLEETA